MRKISDREQECRNGRCSAKATADSPHELGRRGLTELHYRGLPQRILRRADVEAVTGLPRATIYDKISKGMFPRPIKLGERSVGWLETEITEWQKARVADRDGIAAGEDAIARPPK
jgi:prophage regulatory protein